MKKLFFLIAILACVISCQAQTFQVYAVKGDVRCFDGQKGSLVTVGMLLGANTKLTIPNGGRIVFFNEVDKRLYTIKNASSGLIANLLMKDDVLVQQLTDSYLSYVKSKMNGSGNPQDKNYRQSAGVTYRDGDSLILQTLFHQDSICNLIK